MAENESLDLGHRNARRWAIVYDAIQKGQSSEVIAKKARKVFYQAARKALKQLAENGASFGALLANRHAPQALRQLLRESKGHDYALLFAETALQESGSDPQKVVCEFAGGIWNAIADQIPQHVVGNGRWSNFVDLKILLDKVGSHLEPDFRRLGQKLTDDPSWLPTRKPEKNVDQADSTAELLSVSLLGINKN